MLPPHDNCSTKPVRFSERSAPWTNPLGSKRRTPRSTAARRSPCLRVHRKARELSAIQVVDGRDREKHCKWAPGSVTYPRHVQMSLVKLDARRRAVIAASAPLRHVQGGGKFGQAYRTH